MLEIELFKLSHIHFICFVQRDEAKHIGPGVFDLEWILTAFLTGLILDLLDLTDLVLARTHRAIKSR